MHSIPICHGLDQPHTFLHFQDMITLDRDTLSQKLDYSLISEVGVDDQYLFIGTRIQYCRRWTINDSFDSQGAIADKTSAILHKGGHNLDAQDNTAADPHPTIRRRPHCHKPSVSSETLSTVSLSSSITTISMSFADDAADPAKDQSAHSAIASALAFGTTSQGGANESKTSLDYDIDDNSALRRIRSRSSSYPSVGIASPPPGHSSSPPATAYAMSITSNKAGYTSVPFEVDLHFLSILGQEEDTPRPEAGPSLQDELAAMAFASNGSTVQTISERVVSSSLGSLKESRLEPEIPTVTVTSYDTDEASTSCLSRTRTKSSSESSDLPPEAYIICMLDAGQFNVDTSEKKPKKHLEVPSRVASWSNTAPAVKQATGPSRTLAEPGYQDRSPLSMPQSDGVASRNTSLVSLKSELSLLNALEEMPTLTKCPRHSSESDLKGTIKSHVTMSSWIKYAICRTKNCLLTQMGRQPSAKATKKVVLFKAFRDMRRTRVSNVCKPKTPLVSRSLRIRGKSKRPWLFRTADAMDATPSQRAVSCPS